MKYFKLLRLQNPFVLDFRSISIMRIALSICLLFDLSVRFSDMEAHYTELGILPLYKLFKFNWHPEYFSFHIIGNSKLWVLIIFIIQFVSAFSLLLGFKTRISTIFSWILLVSIHNRNPLIHQGADDLLRMLLFYGIFLDWGKYFSIDNYMENTEDKTINFYSIAGIGYLVILFSMYFFSALLKNGSDWKTDYTALYYAYQLDMITYPFGKWLLQYESLIKFLTFFTYYIELILPLFLFIPLKSNWFKYIFICFILLLHIGISSTMLVGIFPFVSISSLMGILPSDFWNKCSALENSLSSFFYLLKNQVSKWSSIHLSSQFKLNHPFAQFFVGLCIFLSIYQNYYGVGNYQIDILHKLDPLVRLLRIDQRWGMFAPIVFRVDGWFVMEATTLKENKIDIYNNGQTLNFNKPPQVVTMVKNDRWRKYQENLLFVHNNHYRSEYCLWLLNQWNQKADSNNMIKHLDVIFVKEMSLAHYQQSTPIPEVLCSCDL
jgi:hypothetical protein